MLTFGSPTRAERSFTTSEAVLKILTPVVSVTGESC
jgi:hypothetical protein